MDNKTLLDEIKKLQTSETHYRTLLDESNDPIFSFYPDGTYRYVNNAFAVGVGKPSDQIIGHTIWDVFTKDEADKRFEVIKKVFEQGKTIEIEVCVPLPSGDTYYLTSAKPAFSDNGTVETVICISKNITKRKLAEIELQNKHDRLVTALEEIKALSGLLPICASCKKIRDDKGYWNQLESYIEEHSEASFSHGLCPDCTENLYGNEKWKKKKKRQRRQD